MHSTPYNPDFVRNNYNIDQIDLMIDIDLFWEVLQAQIRGLIILYGARKKRQQQSRRS